RRRARRCPPARPAATLGDSCIPRQALASADALPRGSAPPPTPTLSLHDALPISVPGLHRGSGGAHPGAGLQAEVQPRLLRRLQRSEEHTSELQSREKLVCRLLLAQKKAPDAQHHVAVPDPPPPAPRRVPGAESIA